MHLNSSFCHLFVVVVVVVCCCCCCCLFVVVVCLFVVVGIECRNGMPKSMQQGRDDVTKFYTLEMEEEGMEGGGRDGERRGGGEEGVEGRKEWRGGRDGGEQKMEERKGWREESERRVKGTATLTSTVYTPILPGCQRRYGS